MFEILTPSLPPSLPPSIQRVLYIYIYVVQYKGRSHSSNTTMSPTVATCRLLRRFAAVCHAGARFDRHVVASREREWVREQGGGREVVWGGYQRLIKNDAICLRLRRLPLPPSTPSIKGAALPARPVINLPLYYRSDLSLNSALPPPPPPPSCGGLSLSPCHAAVSRRPPGSSFPRVEQ